ncbi:Na+/H+ antiporter subunit E [Epidermidibacterium keratini]|uniref:Na+/H+ antiporter subunit E n=1 Tax=Epidermidibacterium keratini TaxID=1891644 RepID=A0A7L4YPS7_9ACTN|nr:Na+/H+ antiporter subunit E [Epidermidibacterium keratini]QHC00799.1 Na+/H+ antiporter subunit E [Epidermidibacterium keratini]
MIGRGAITRTRLQRGGFQPRAIIAVALLWTVLWDSITWGNVVNGLLIGLVITTVLPLPSVPYDGRIHPLRFLALLVLFFRDLVVASFQLSWLAVRPKVAETGSIIEVKMRVHSDLYLTLLAVMISLVPGSTVVEARRTAGVLYVHELGVHTREQADQARADVLAVERRLVRAIGSKEEIAMVDGEGTREREKS